MVQQGQIDHLLQETGQIVPPPALVQQAYLQDYDAAYADSLDLPEDFWAGVASELEWSKPWDQVFQWDYPTFKWFLGANGAILTKYVGGAPHADMFETARCCEDLGIKTVVQASSTAPDGRAESALLMTAPGVDAVVTLSEGDDIKWPVLPVDRVIAGNPEVAAALSAPLELTAGTVCGACNNQGASRLQPILY